jgi:hypothetical protein
MKFNKLVSENQKKLESTDLKLIRAIEDIISVQNLIGLMPQQVQDLIKEREELRRNLGGEDNG